MPRQSAARLHGVISAERRTAEACFGAFEFALDVAKLLRIMPPSPHPLRFTRAEFAGAFGVVSVFGVGRIVDDAQLAALIEETVTALDEAVLVALLVTKLTIVTGKKIRESYSFTHKRKKSEKN